MSDQTKQIGQVAWDAVHNHGAFRRDFSNDPMRAPFLRANRENRDPRERAEYIAASKANAAMADWRPATDREDGSRG